MPQIDKPLAELRRYTGTNPKPADFDAFWNAALEDQRATDPNPKLDPSSAISSAVAEPFDLWFTGTGGARVHAKYLRPKTTSGPGPCVLQFHGYGGNCSDWRSKIALVSQGIAVASMDVRGQGGLSEDVGRVTGNTLHGHIIRGLDSDDPHQMFYRHAFLDTVQLARVVAGFDEIDPNRLGTMGGSQGGALSIACASLEPSIKRCSSEYPFLSDYRRVWDMDLAKAAYEELQTYFKLFDPLHEREEEVFTKLGYIDVHHLAPRIEAESLMGISLMDTVCPPSTQFAVFNAIRATKQEVIYPDFGHENLPGYADREFNFLSQL